MAAIKPVIISAIRSSTSVNPLAFLICIVCPAYPFKLCTLRRPYRLSNPTLPSGLRRTGRLVYNILYISSIFIKLFISFEATATLQATSGLKMQIRSRAMEYRSLDYCRALVEPTCAALGTRSLPMTPWNEKAGDNEHDTHAPQVRAYA